MAVIKLTPEQQKVVDTRNCNLLVAAAAGSGKTAVLVKRIIKKVTEEGQDIDRLLIVTFTNAAAAEMRERIGAAIEEALEQNPESTHLQKQMLLLHNAQITTIHSFCLSVIREYFHLIQLDPGFRIGDEAELALLRSDVLEEVLEEQYEKEEEAFLAFTECFGSVKNNEAVSGYIMNLYGVAMSQPFPEQWMDSLAESFRMTEEEFKNHPMVEMALEEARKCIGDCQKVLAHLFDLTEEPDGPMLYLENFKEDSVLLGDLLHETKTYDGFYKAISEAKFGRLAVKKKDTSDEEKKQLAKTLREYIKKQIGKLREDFFYESREELWGSITAMERPMTGLVEVTKEFLRRYEKKRQENCILDFNDLEHKALQILIQQTDNGSCVPTEAAKTLSKRYDEIMIDEYQDSNMIQELILTSVSGMFREQPNVFMVGDVKQSIYRFRMACPDLFMQKYETYGDSGKEQKIDLARNFRSRKGVLDAINVLFAGLMHKDSTEVEYDAAAALYFGAAYPAEKAEHRTEVLFVSLEEESKEALDGADVENSFRTAALEDGEETGSGEGKTEDGELSGEEKTMVQAEAFAVAARIKELVHSGLTIGSEERPAEYGDIVILLRTMSGWSEAFLEVFAEQGIPAYADTSSGYFKTFEVKKTLDFLRILDNPKQDIPFAAVLHSPMAGLNAEELARIRINYGKVPGEEKKQKCLYTAAREAALEGQSEKLIRFFALYDRLRAEASYVSIHELIEHFYSYSGFYDVVTVMPGGERRRGNLDMLVVRAKQYEATSFSGLYDFIRYIDRLIKYDVDFGEANNGETGQMVRIMSIHKSKGLEFPVVFLCGMEKKLNRQDMRNRLIIHSGYGLGPEFADPVLRVKSPTLFKKILAAKMNEEMIAEELRILYVAMTRAREKLIMTGAMKHPEKRYAAWWERSETVDGRGVLSSYVKNAGSYYDFLCPLLFAEKRGSAVSDWQGNLPAGVTVSMTKKLQTEQFTGEFFLQEYREEKALEEKQETVKTKGELLEVLRQMKYMEPENSESAEHLRTLIKQQEAFVYPYGSPEEIPVKVTVSELKRLQLEQEERDAGSRELPRLVEDTEAELLWEETKPAEMPECTYPEYLRPEKKLSGADRGTVYHRVMELIPFTESSSKAQIAAYLDAMAESETLSEEERKIVSEGKLAGFFASSLGKRMCRAAEENHLYREQPFVLGMPAKELYPETDSDEIVLVQGIIDAFFEEEDGIVLMDYKTDYIHEDAKAELTKKYKGQLRYYRRALERLTGKPVKETWFYSFAKEEDFRIEEDD